MTCRPAAERSKRMALGSDKSKNNKKQTKTVEYDNCQYKAPFALFDLTYKKRIKIDITRHQCSQTNNPENEKKNGKSVSGGQLRPTVYRAAGSPALPCDSSDCCR